MHISKIVDYLKNEINFSEEFCEDNVFVTLRIEPILKIIENLEQSHKDILEYAKEIENKDKIIDLMADSFAEEGFYSEHCQTLIDNDICPNDCNKCVKQYFERKMEKC